MASKSLTKNSIYYLIYNTLNVVFPLITGIYVAHILLPRFIGEVGYAQNISTYFVILAFLGIPTYGMREIAKCRDDKEKVKKLHAELLTINALSTSLFLISYLILIFLVSSFRANIILYLITGFSIVLNYLNNSWLFQGLEEFKYISIRNIIFKVILFALLVLFVKKENDYIAYALVSTFGSAGAYLLNILYAKKKIGFNFKNLELKKHLKPILYLVVVNLAVEIYTLVDTTMIGIFCDKNHVAFYGYGSKIYKVLLQIINTFTVVIVPRLSFYFKNNKTTDFNCVLTKTFKILILLAVPTIIGIQFVSNFLVVKVYGEEYISSALVIRILCFNLLISPVGYLLGSRMMLISGNENKMIIPVAIGCVVNVALNLVLIPLYKEIGASIASVAGEICVAIVYILFGRRFFKLESLQAFAWKFVVAIAIMTGFLLLMECFPTNSWHKLVLQLVGASFLYFLTLIALKEKTTTSFYLKARSFLRI